MIGQELYLQYKVGKKGVKKLKLPVSGKPFTVGASKNADLQVHGPDICPFHCAFEYRDGKWYLLDLASETGTWVQNKTISEKELKDLTDFKIGELNLTVKPVQAKRLLFHENKEEANLNCQEVVVRGPRGIVETAFLGLDEGYVFTFNRKQTQLPAPTTSDWKVTEFGDYKVQQRLTHKPDQAPEAPFEWAGLDLGFKVKPAHGMAAGGVILAILIALLLPSAPTEEEQKLELKKNRYTRLLYDSKLIKKKRQQALKIAQKKFKAPTKSAPQKATSAKRTASRKATKVISKIKASGLKRLLGKISSRINVNAPTIAAKGGRKGSSRTLASVGGGKGTAAGVSAGKSFKVAGISTVGKGGGKGSYKGLGKLNQGQIGSASVGLLEDEGEVSGEMDRDLIAAVIRKNIGQIRYCYERRLVAKPSLYGKVLVQFNIEDLGKVKTPSVARTSLKDSAVEGCILRRIAQWQFPVPPKGTSVIVSYPFLFKSTQ